MINDTERHEVARSLFPFRDGHRDRESEKR